MFVYWLLFLVPILGVTMPVRLIGKLQVVVWMITSAIVALIIGTRYEIGGDWGTLLTVSEYLKGKGLHVAIAHEGPGYGAINWLSVNLGLGIYGVNLACGALFVTGLAIFCRRQPIPWLAWLIATPYLIVVVGMGYTKQSVALGFLLWGLVYLEDKKAWHYLFLVLIGAAFHKTVLLMAPLAILGWRGNIWFRIGSLVLIFLALLAVGANYRALVYSNVVEPNELFRFWHKYIDNDQWFSIGASYRVWLNAIPAALMLLLWRSWHKRFKNIEIWIWLAIASIGSVFFVGIASTAIDRVNLYLAPIQLYFWTRLPILVSDRLLRTLIILGTVFFYGLILWFWLNLAENAGNWVPYKSILTF